MALEWRDNTSRKLTFYVNVPTADPDSPPLYTNEYDVSDQEDMMNFFIQYQPMGSYTILSFKILFIISKHCIWRMVSPRSPK